MKITYLITFMCLVMSICNATAFDAPTAAEVTDLKVIIKAWMIDGTWGMKVLRLAFHDCVGGKCDGCINLNNAANDGLSDVITALEVLYEDNAIDAIMSRADYWQLSANLAIKVGIINANGDCATDDDSCRMPNDDLTFKWGRVDCDTSPSTDEVHDFPEPTMSRSEMMTFFSTWFDMGEDEVTALMGAHNLGGASRTNSGYSGLWTPGNKAKFNTEFYQHLADVSLTFDNVAKLSKSNSDRKYQFDLYDTAGGFVGMMLNTDVELIADIDVDALEGTSCTINGDCTVVEATKSLVEEYASNTTKFKDDYGIVHLKMSETGYDNLQEVS